MAKNICHLLMAFGNKNQSYTTDLLEKINESSENEHFVFCNKIFETSNDIKVFDSFQQNKIIAIFEFFKLYAGDESFRQVTRKFTTRRERYKWIQLVQLDFDVIHVHHAQAISYDVLDYLAKKKIKIVISLRGRDLLVNTLNQKKFEELYDKLKLADEIHCISEYMQKKLFEISSLKAKVIYRGQLQPKKNNIKNSYKITNEIKIIVVGRLVWEKGHVFLLESIYRLKQRGYKIKVDIYGTGNIEEFLEFRIKQLNIENEVELKGFLENNKLKEIYKNYDIALQPSISEALSNGLIDLVLHNIPCVITDVGGMPEIIENNKNGIIFPQSQMELMDEAILKACNLKPDVLKPHNKNLRDKFSFNQEIESLNQLYIQ